MKTFFHLSKNITGVILLCLACSSCLKPSDSEIKPSFSAPFTNGDLVKALSGQPSLSLFKQAFDRLSIAGRLEKNKNYTIFAPTDSAMKAAGLDASAIGRLSIDSLGKLIYYHIAVGAFDDISLTSSVVSRLVQTFRQDTSFNMQSGYSVYTPPLYVKKGGIVYINGLPASGNVSAIPASNGYIYQLSRVLSQSIGQNSRVYNIIKTDPELSLYHTAILLVDSVRADASIRLLGYVDERLADVYALSVSFTVVYNKITLLAPTNTAFNNAGFYTADDLRKYALRTPIDIDYSTYTLTYSPLDSLLKQHWISTKGALVLYNDMLSPDINNNVFNVAPVRLPFNLQFSSAAGKVYVQWNSSPASKVLLPEDPDPTQPENNFITDNGALYKINTLFYPHN